MSLADARQEITDALGAVSGVTGYLKPPSVIAVGDGWPVLSSMAKDRVSGQFLVTWRVLVVLPGDDAAYLTAFESLASLLDDALALVGYVTQIAPAQIITKTATLNGIEAQLIRE